MQSTRSLSSATTNRPVTRRRRRDITRPLTDTWAGNPHGAAWMKAQALDYARWRLHVKAKRYENSQGTVWCGYLAVFLAWCLFTLLIPHLAVLSPRYGLAPDIVTRVLLACLVPTLGCMALLNAYSALIASRAARLHNSLSLTATVQTLAEWLEDEKERPAVLCALTELLPHLGMEAEAETGVGNADGTKGADALSARARMLLLQTLRREYDREPAFAVAMLRGLEQWGDKTSIPVVTRIAGQSVQPAVADAAHHCLAVLYARFEQRRARSVLLRASEDANDILLRSVHVRPEDEAEQLLRANIGNAPR